MKPIALALAALLSIPCMAHASDTSATTLYMPDGQLKSHMVRVYIDKEIGAVSPSSISMTLHTAHSLRSAAPQENDALHPIAIDTAHTWTLPVGDSSVSKQGTMLLFDLKGYPIPDYKTAMRVLPELNWCAGKNNGQEDCHVIGEHEVYLANPVGAYLWAAVTVIALVILTGVMSRRVFGRAIYLLCEPGGKLSLSRTQMALWTLAIGGIVEAFGLTRLDVPDIPETLLALMGASLLTTGISYARSEQPAAPRTRAPHWYDLICDGASNSLSLERAQMLFWTVISLGIFVSKSILDGAMWHVPPELVGLMGMSQLAYLAPKLNPAAEAQKSVTAVEKKPDPSSAG